MIKYKDSSQALLSMFYIVIWCSIICKTNVVKDKKSFIILKDCSCSQILRVGITLGIGWVYRYMLKKRNLSGIGLADMEYFVSKKQLVAQSVWFSCKDAIAKLWKTLWSLALIYMDLCSVIIFFLSLFFTFQFYVNTSHSFLSLLRWGNYGRYQIRHTMLSWSYFWK